PPSSPRGVKITSAGVGQFYFGADTKYRDLKLPSHAHGLSETGLHLLRVLWNWLRSERINAEDPATFPRYTELVADLNVLPMRGPRVGQQLREHGLDDLDEWTRWYGLPAICGLVVTGRGSNAKPGDAFFDNHGRNRDDLAWWRKEARAATEYDWSRVADV